MPCSKLLAFLISLLLVSLNTQAKDIVYMGLGEERDTYHSALLEELLRHTSLKGTQIKTYDKPLPHHRAFQFMGEQHEIDLVIGYATKEREALYLSVPIPLLKGLNGWRLSAVHKDNKDVFAQIKTLDALRKMKPGQLGAWTDTKILAANDLHPVKVSNFDGLYNLLQKKWIDFIPRSAIEIHSEVSNISRKYNDITIEPHILIVYPTALYMYVNKSDTELAHQLKLGFEIIIANGVFDQIFYQFYGDIIKRIEKNQRFTFLLNNPFLPNSTPLNRSELWVY